MPKNSLSAPGLPGGQAKTLKGLGQRIRTARKRRSLTLAELAERMLVDEKTLRRLERGDPGVSLAVLVSAMFCLELTTDLERIAAIETDQLGLFLEQQRLGRMRGVRKHQDSKLDF